MVRFFQISVFAFITLRLSFAQQLEFPKWGSEPSVRYYTESFNKRYSNPYTNHITLKSTAFYKEHKVKKILIYTAGGKLSYLFELDTAGNIIRQGYPYHYFTVYSSGRLNEETSAYSYAYYQDSILVRTDTIFNKIISYKHGDTAMAYKQVRTKVYKIGFLINEQNRYYNDRFYKKHFKESGIIPVTYYVKTLGIRHRSRRGLIYIKNKLTCNYDSMKLYFGSETYYNSNFNAHTEITKKDIDSQKDLHGHPFYNRYQVSEKNSYKIQGEDFNEPIVTTEASYCGNHYYYQQRRIEEQKHYSSEIKFNQKGLYESYYQLYYPEDTSDAAKEIVKKQRESFEGAKKNGTPVLTLDYGDKMKYPRSEIPLKTLIWKIRYEYF